MHFWPWIWKAESLRELQTSKAIYNGMIPEGYAKYGCYFCDGTDETCPKYQE